MSLVPAVFRFNLIVALRDRTFASSAPAAAVVVGVPSAPKPVLWRCPEQLAGCQPLLRWLIGSGALSKDQALIMRASY